MMKNLRIFLFINIVLFIQNEFKNNILVGSLKFKRLHVIKVHENIPISEKIILENKIGRIRDIEEMHDGSIILINDELKGGVYRLYRQ